MTRSEDDTQDDGTGAEIVHWYSRRRRPAPILPAEARSLVVLAVGATAFGAIAVGALSIGALAVGRLVIGRGRVRDLRIDRLTIGTLTVLDRE